MKLGFSGQIFEKKNQVINLMKISGLGAEFFFHAEGEIDRQTDGQTDMTKLIDAFRNFWEKRLKNRECVRSAVILC